MSRVVYKFRLYPNQQQEQLMLEWIETCRRLWNNALRQRSINYCSKNKQMLELTEIRKNNKFLNKIYSQILQDIIKRLDK